MQPEVRIIICDCTLLINQTYPSGKRGRASAVAEEGTSFEWRWGSRAHSEVGEQAIAQFVAEFMVGHISNRRRGNEDESEEEGNVGRRGANRHPKSKEEEKDKILQNMLKGITRAVGGPLQEIH